MLTALGLLMLWLFFLGVNVEREACREETRSELVLGKRDGKYDDNCEQFFEPLCLSTIFSFSHKKEKGSETH